MTSTLCDDAQKGMEEDRITKGGLREVKRSPGMYTTGKGTRLGHDSSIDGENMDEHDDHGDSGVFNSSRNTTDSISDDTDQDELSRRGVFEYFPHDTKSQIPTIQKLMNAEVQHRNSRAYDEHEFVEDSDGDDQSFHDDDENELREVVTVRNEEIEMKTIKTEIKSYRSVDRYPDRDIENSYLRQENDRIRMRNNEEYDEAYPVIDDEDFDQNNGSAHELLYGRRYQNASMRQEDEEEYLTETHQPVHARYMPARSAFRSRFAGTNPSISGNRSDRSDGVSIQRDVRKKQNGPQPPFGNPLDRETILSQSSTLIGSHPSSKIPNMPFGERIRNDSLTKDRDLICEGSNVEGSSKKKKKKKKSGKSETEDSGGEHDRDFHYDVNGNPMESVRIRPENKSLNSQSIFPRNFEDLRSYPVNNRPICDMEDSMTGSTSSVELKKKTRVTRRKEIELAKSIKAEHIEGYQGEKSVEELLGFIENITISNNTNNNGNKKKKKASNIVVNGNPEGAPTSESEIYDSGSNRNNKKVKQEPSNKPKNSILPKDSDKIPSSADERGENTKSKDSVKVEDSKIAESITVPEPLHQAVLPEKAISSKNKVGSEKLNMKDITENDRFIFTDFDKQQTMREDEFKVVKRKKNVRSTPSTQQTMSVTNKENLKDGSRSFDLIGNTNCPNRGLQSKAADMLRTRDDRSLHDERISNQRKSRPLVRSVTPPPPSTAHQTEGQYQQEKPSERAFSPSAFPALGGMREGRRNSTGNVPSETAPDDSDLESVKSLPMAVASDTKTEGVICPIISYAKIAAGSKTLGKSSVTTSATSVNSSVKLDDDAKVEEISYVQPSLQLSCETEEIVPGQRSSISIISVHQNSSENISPKQSEGLALTIESGNKIEPDIKPETSEKDVDCVATSVSKTENKIGNSKKQGKVVNPNRNKVGYSPQMPYCDNEIHQNLTFVGSGSIDFDKAPEPPIIDTVPPILSHKDFPPISEASRLYSISQKSAAKTSQASSIMPPIPQSQQEMHHPDNPPAPATAATQDMKKSSGSSAAVSNNKKYKNKSVVFLDNKGSHSSSQNLGLSFGFDSNLTFMDNKPEEMNSNNQNNDGETVIKLGAINGVVPALMNAISVKDTMSTQEGAHSESGDANVISSSNTETTVIKEPVVLETLVDKHSAQAGPNDDASKVRVCSGAESSPVTFVKVDPGLPSNSDKRFINLQNLVKPDEAQDPNYDKGRFFVEDAVVYLKKEWDQINKMINQNPGSITVYSSQ